MSDIDDTSSVTALSEAVTETASQPSALNTRSAAAGSTVFATLRPGTIRTEVSLMCKIKIGCQDLRADRVATQEEEGEDVAYRSGEGRLLALQQCDKKKVILLYALLNCGINGVLRRLRKDHGLLVGEVDGETTETEPPRRRQRQRTVLDLQKQAVERLAIRKSKAELFKELLLRWIVDADIPTLLGRRTH
ncbi:hypothetical protein EDB81DRAFT_830567 [Dactylonectria macrodidyma]|uniref:Uncharacterized protein n=1 Tax=Dactylonectria macrodidyma TaxID=307937 RepID=A0A9P9D2B9_9HYPO|nr:hypothetical protein EDB81DRAFT_830567 [Dactylonectria macrodidyma]